MNLALLETFAAVMKTGSATRAAALLGVSQPAVSRALLRLEDTTRLRLFERTGKRISPTPEAEALYREVLAARAGLDRVRQTAARLREVGTGLIRVGSSAALGLHLIPQAMRRFLDSRPGVSVSLEVTSSAAVRDGVAGGTFDLGVSADEVDRSNVTAEFLFRSPGVLVVPPGHAMVGARMVGPGDLDGVAMVALAPEDRARQRLAALLARTGAKPVMVAETPFSATVCELAMQGLGVGLANWMAYAAGGFAERGLVARPFRPIIEFRALLLLPPRPARSVLVDEFVAALRAQIAALPPAPE